MIGLTLQQMCDVLAYWLNCRTHKNLTGHQIYTASPSGELWYVFDLAIAMQRDSVWLDMHPYFSDRVSELPDNPAVGDVVVMLDGIVKLWDGASWR